MIHGPCGLSNKSAACMRDGNCSKRSPKEFSCVSSTANDGYPNYRRKDNGRSVQVGKAVLNNRWVVPYNPFLLLKYNAHINVEICTTVSSSQTHSNTDYLPISIKLQLDIDASLREPHDRAQLKKSTSSTEIRAIYC